MEWLKPDLFDLFLKLLPGFLAATIFHALTPYPKRDVFDRLVAALIFTMFAGLAVAVARWVLFWIGAHYGTMGAWSPSVELGWGALFGIVLGVVWSHVVNKGWTHSVLFKTGTTKKTSLPTQWYGAFSKYERYVVVHFKNGRRLMGWPLEWPDQPDSGHFLLQRAGWLTDDGKKAALLQIEVLLVSNHEVECVEFLRFGDDPELERNAQVIQDAASILAATRKDPSDGRPPKASAPN